MIIEKEISKAVRLKRADLGLTKSHASQKIGISRNTLRKIETEQNANVNSKVFTRIMTWIIKNS